MDGWIGVVGWCMVASGFGLEIQKSVIAVKQVPPTHLTHLIPNKNQRGEGSSLQLLLVRFHVVHVSL